MTGKWLMLPDWLVGGLSSSLSKDKVAGVDNQGYTMVQLWLAEKHLSTENKLNREADLQPQEKMTSSPTPVIQHGSFYMIICFFHMIGWLFNYMGAHEFGCS